MMLKEARAFIRRRVAVLLALLMAVSCLPVSALADEDTGEEQPSARTAELPAPKKETLPSLPAELTDEDSAEEITSGSCGENLTWTLVDGVLTISGTGEMYNFSSDNAPWYNIRSRIESVVIEDGVTSVGINAFNGCSNLTSVELPDSMERIWYAAFPFCNNLKSITIPNGVKDIGFCAFYGCSSLENVTISESLTNIGDEAFRECYSLANQDGYVIVNSILFDFIYKKTEIVIPDGVTQISGSVFHNSRDVLKSVTIPNSVGIIRSNAFDGCDAITPAPAVTI